VHHREFGRTGRHDDDRRKQTNAHAISPVTLSRVTSGVRRLQRAVCEHGYFYAGRRDFPYD
jgi:hypothetical protein